MIKKKKEDAPEEPKEYWYIAHNGIVGCFEYDDDWQYMDFNWQDKLKQIGNYFETREEAELAVRKLKAWKGLKDEGFEFDGIGFDEHGRIYIKTNLSCVDLNVMENPNLESRLNLLFGGEE